MLVAVACPLGRGGPGVMINSVVAPSSNMDVAATTWKKIGYVDTHASYGA